MNDHELEAMLQGLRPRRLPPRLLATPAGETPAAATSGGAWRSWLQPGWVGWACAALFAIGLIASRLAVPAARPALRLTPAGAERIVIQGGEADVVTLADGSTARRYRLRSLDTYTWTDPETKASLRWTVPREDVQVLPIRIN